MTRRLLEQPRRAGELLLDLSEPRGEPLHLRLTQALRTAIQTGRISGGTRLVPSRTMAIELGCSRWVVTEAYEQLCAEGYLESTVGSGTRVRLSDTNPEVQLLQRGPAADAVFDLLPGLPDVRAFPWRAWLTAMRTAVGAAEPLDISHPQRGGHPQLREELAHYLSRVRGTPIAADQVVVSTGITDGLTRICRLLSARGVGAAAVEEPGWPRISAAVADAGLQPVPTCLDDEGIDVQALQRQGPVGAVVVGPAHQFPTGVVMSHVPTEAKSLGQSQMG